MNTRNIKTVIIILLAAANIFLLYNISELNRQVQNIPAGMIADASDILRAWGIDADIKIIPADKPVNYIYEGVIYNYHEIVKSFTGASDEQITDGGSTTPEGGMLFNIGEYKFWFADDMLIEINKADYTADMFGGLDRADGPAGDEAGIIISGFLDRYAGQDIRTGFEITGMRSDGDISAVRINQTVDGLYIAPHSAYIIIDGGELKYFYGRWYFGTFAREYEMPLLDSVNILFKSMEQDDIAGAGLGHMGKEYNILKQYGIDTFYFTPSWVISYDDGRVFSYDMITGIKNN